MNDDERAACDAVDEELDREWEDLEQRARIKRANWPDAAQWPEEGIDLVIGPTYDEYKGPPIQWHTLRVSREMLHRSMDLITSFADGSPGLSQATIRQLVLDGLGLGKERRFLSPDEEAFMFYILDQLGFERAPEFRRHGSN